jgi:hypothetical protein
VLIGDETAMPLPMHIEEDHDTGIVAVTIDIAVEASAEFVWDVLRDVYAVDTRLIPGFATGVVEGPGTRTVTFSHGTTVTERIVELDEAARRIVYQAVDAPFTHHLGSQAVREGEDGVHLVWTTEFAPASLLDGAIRTMQSAAKIMKATIDQDFADT